ncbi:histidinol-phosphate transaminase [Nocardioidaceae bacterium SCSIO 66511]|nr:histidinol-phosphate transaminase [Nocardioidaceae bacterium SCSIO 66511]
MSERQPRIRDVFETIPTYRPGKPPEPKAGRSTFKLSSNENPYPPLPGVVEKIAGASERINRYPDMGSVHLYERLSERFGVPVDNLAAGTGSVAVLYHLLQAVCERGDEVVYAWRSFEAYPIAVQVTGATSVTVPLNAKAEHDLDAMLDAITDRTKVVIVCTPNNPTGPVVRRDALSEFIDRVPPHVVVVIDEAYREFVRDPHVADGVDLYRDRDNVVCLRTFSKAYGLAGLRIGYAIAPAPLAAAVRKASLPFGVSDFAQVAATASLEAEDALLERVEALVAERTRVVDALRGQGWTVPDTQANFFWLELGADTLDFAAACAAEGVMIRPFAGDGARITIGESEANDIVLEVAQEWRRAHG